MNTMEYSCIPDFPVSFISNIFNIMFSNSNYIYQEDEKWESDSDFDESDE